MAGFGGAVDDPCLVAVGAANPGPVAQETLSGPALLQALRAGGYVIYFRHASTDFGQNDDRMAGYEDCSLQRNLTDLGRDEARAIGRDVASLRIPIGDVLPSPLSHDQTARLAFGLATSTEAVRGVPSTDDGDRYRGLRTLLAGPVLTRGLRKAPMTRRLREM